ncbi:MAG: hypothetical protein Q9186_003087 [Xanthomendoza sp. 1 TL-2023]
MFIFSMFTLAAVTTIMSMNIVYAQLQPQQPIDRALRDLAARNPQAFWTKIPPSVHRPSAGSFGQITYFGITWTNRSKTSVSDRDFLLTGVEVLEDIYNNHANASEVVRHYQGPTVLMNPPGLNIAAVGRGVEPGLPITFNNAAMVLFTRWLVQAFPPYRWYEFNCEYGVVVAGKPVSFVVAKGQYTAFNLGAFKFTMVRQTRFGFRVRGTSITLNFFKYTPVRPLDPYRYLRIAHGVLYEIVKELSQSPADDHGVHAPNLGPWRLGATTITAHNPYLRMTWEMLAHALKGIYDFYDNYSTTLLQAIIVDDHLGYIGEIEVGHGYDEGGRNVTALEGGNLTANGGGNMAETA